VQHVCYARPAAWPEKLLLLTRAPDIDRAPSHLRRIAHYQSGLEPIVRVLVCTRADAPHQSLQAEGRKAINVLRNRRQRGARILTKRVIVVPGNAEIPKSTN
jgi:hypothetical protein